MKYLLLLVLFIASLALIYLGITNTMQPPVWTGVGFLAIAGLFLLKSKEQS